MTDSPITTVLHPVADPTAATGGGRLVATVTDPDGNVLGLLQDTEVRNG
jgi:predicted enzyme related to lactoylglutathione lyase